MAPSLSPLETDALREIGEMCIGAGTGAMAKLTGARVTHLTSQVHEVPARDLPARLGVAGAGIIGASVTLRGEMRGALLVAFTEAGARRVADLLQERPSGWTKQLGPMEQSALKEFANVAAGHYLKAFYGFLGMGVDHGVPTFAVAAWEPLVKYTFLGATPGATSVWAVASAIDLGVEEPGRVFLLLDAAGLERVRDAIKRRLG